MGYRVEFQTSGPGNRVVEHRLNTCRFPTLLDATRIAAVEANAMALVGASDIEVRIFDRHDQLAHKIVATSPLTALRETAKVTHTGNARQIPYRNWVSTTLLRK